VQDGHADKIRILIVDDHQLFILGLRTILELEPDMEIVGEASSGTEAIDAADRLHPDVILMDVRMPHMNGFEATRLVVDKHPEIGVVMLSLENSPVYHSTALQNGARGFLPKDSGKAEIARMVRQASSAPC
jgi:DNA-binding NarL/FixJ family response regulator